MGGESPEQLQKASKEKGRGAKGEWFWNSAGPKAGPGLNFCLLEEEEALSDRERWALKYEIGGQDPVLQKAPEGPFLMQFQPLWR